MAKKLTTEEFIEKAHKIHGLNYDYSKTIYNGTFDNVCIICAKHGEFWQSANSHLSGHGCKKCYSEKAKKTNEKFLSELSNIHGGKIIAKEEYHGRRDKILVKCSLCGNEWKARADSLLSGCGCPKCFKESKKDTKENFILKAREIHGWKYDYSKVEYINNKTKVCIICPEHGEFWQTPDNHLYLKQGCPNCIKYKLEEEVLKLLIDNNIQYEQQKKFEWLKNKSNLRLDFYLPEYKIAIECQGEQHFKPVKAWGGESKLKYTNENDKLKKEKCAENGIKILYYSKEKNNDCCNSIDYLLKNILVK